MASFVCVGGMVVSARRGRISSGLTENLPFSKTFLPIFRLAQIFDKSRGRSSLDRAIVCPAGSSSLANQFHSSIRLERSEVLPASVCGLDEHLARCFQGDRVVMN